MYKQKYLKYKNKYLNLKDELSGGVGLVDVPEGLLPKMVSDNSTTCLQTMNTAKTSKPFANAIDFPNLTNNITTNIPNIYNRTSGVCRQIDNVARRNECNAYNNRCYIKELFDKYSNILYLGQLLAAPVAPAIYNVNTLNEILLRTIPNNIEYPDKVIDQQNLIRFGADILHIDNNAFANNQLREITIPPIITTIGNNAFAHNQLVQLTIPDSVRTISNNAFAHNQLDQLFIPDTVTTIENGAFSFNQLIELRLPSTIIRIADYAFNHNNLAQVIIPNTVINIGNYAFSYNRLVRLTIPNTVLTIGTHAFDMNKLIEVTLPRRFEQQRQLLRIFGPDYGKIVFTYTE